MTRHPFRAVLFTLFLSIFISACAQLSVAEREEARSERDSMADKTITTLLAEREDLQENLNSAVGYMVTNWKVTKVPVVGAGSGNGVIVDLKTKERIYVDVKRFDIGGGLGAKSYKNLLIVQSQELLNNLKDGHVHFEAGAEVAAGTATVEGSSGALNEDYKLYLLLDGGGSATATARALSLSIDKELTKR